MYSADYSAALPLLLLLTVAHAGLVFVNPQSDCKIQCQNGGACVYESSNPRLHKCMCYVGMYEGEFCEKKVSTDPTPVEEDASAERYEDAYTVDADASRAETDSVEESEVSITPEYEEATTKREFTDPEYEANDATHHQEMTPRASQSAQYAVEETDDGWMMVRRSRLGSGASGYQLPVTLLATILLVLCL